MLVPLATIKSYLEITVSTYDDFLTEQEEIISDAIIQYCGRFFLTATYTQTFYRDQLDEHEISNVLLLAQYPIASITSITQVDDSSTITTDYRIHKPTGTLTRKDEGWFDSTEELEVVFVAGTNTVPTPIKDVIYSLVGERYNKKIRGVDLNFGSDVQRISIAGAMSIDFDYSLQANQRNVGLGMILGNYVNVLDVYRSERPIIGSVRLEYV